VGESRLHASGMSGVGFCDSTSEAPVYLDVVVGRVEFLHYQFEPGIVDALRSD